MEANVSVVDKPKQWMDSTRDFWRDTTGEMKKVTWPTRSEVIGTTVVVLIATMVFALYLWGADQVFFFLTTKLFSYFGASA
jgi:preprotein translocase subunit SecE